MKLLMGEPGRGVRVSTVTACPRAARALVSARPRNPVPPAMAIFMVRPVASSPLRPPGRQVADRHGRQERFDPKDKRKGLHQPTRERAEKIGAQGPVLF